MYLISKIGRTVTSIYTGSEVIIIGGINILSADTLISNSNYCVIIQINANNSQEDLWLVVYLNVIFNLLV